MSSIQEREFIRGMLATFSGPFIPPHPPLPKKSKTPDDGFYEDMTNLQDDWVVVGNYLFHAIQDNERSITEGK